MTQWRYYFHQVVGKIMPESEEHVNELGRAGWELVSMVQSHRAELGVLFVFKRPVE